MDAEYRTRLLSNRTAMALAGEMLAQRLITAEEYGRIDRIIAKSRGLDLCGICCRDPLLSLGLRANMPPTKGGDSDGKNS